MHKLCSLYSLLASSLLLIAALALVSCEQGERSLSSEQAQEALSESHFVFKKTLVQYNKEDGLWYEAGQTEPYNGVAWIPDEGKNVDEYYHRAEDDPNAKEPQSDRLRSIRYFVDGKQQGPSITFTLDGNPNVIHYYHDNEMRHRWRFSNQDNFTRKESIAMKDGHAHGEFSRWYPNGQMAVTGAYIKDEKGVDHRTGWWTEWSPEGEIILKAEFDPSNGNMKNIETAAEGFELIDAGDFYELKLKGKLDLSVGYPVIPGSQAETWLLERSKQNSSDSDSEAKPEPEPKPKKQEATEQTSAGS